MGTMRIVHDLSSFTQQPSIKPFLLEITLPKLDHPFLRSSLASPRSRYVLAHAHVSVSKIRFRLGDTYAFVKGQSNFYDSFEGWGGNEGDNFLRRSVAV